MLVLLILHITVPNNLFKIGHFQPSMFYKWKVTIQCFITIQLMSALYAMLGKGAFVLVFAFLYQFHLLSSKFFPW